MQVLCLSILLACLRSIQAQTTIQDDVDALLSIKQSNYGHVALNTWVNGTDPCAGKPHCVGTHCTQYYQDRQQATAVLASTNFSTHGMLAGWSFIGCQEGRVVEIHLSNLGLNGTLPQELGKCSDGLDACWPNSAALITWIRQVLNQTFAELHNHGADGTAAAHGSASSLLHLL